ncbi:hypothetical protein P280DRAFT_461661 [Massarina eburnea CBS 473.64]|uniref:Rhodopsin domain-containing protein n=1 Tax=Massarina eburnea CBS 473.64 TaxID=1395130 RepID=A0A6A6RKG4_9PLEO|nr:hypothetical protein P280DRAFT_461661 [Massarina eburnea CBS 473.64]
MWTIPANNLTASFKANKQWLYVTYFMYQIAEALCQLSICAFYIRLLTSPTSRQLTWALMVLVTCFGIGNTFAMAFQCWPIPFFWDGWRGEMAGACTVDVRLFGFIRGAIEIVLDLTILSLPLPTLYRLQMSTRKKLQVMSMFCVGFVITVVSCLRLHALVAFDQSTNLTYDNTPGVYWCVTEANLFIVVACMPAMRPFLQRSVPSFFSSFRDGNGYASKQQYGSSGPGKGAVRLGNSSENGCGQAPPFGISKTLDVRVYRTDETRSGSDVELVDRPGMAK